MKIRKLDRVGHSVFTRAPHAVTKQICANKKYSTLRGRINKIYGLGRVKGRDEARGNVWHLSTRQVRVGMMNGEYLAGRGRDEAGGNVWHLGTRQVRVGMMQGEC